MGTEPPGVWTSPVAVWRRGFVYWQFKRKGRSTYILDPHREKRAWDSGFPGALASVSLWASFVSAALWLKLQYQPRSLTTLNKINLSRVCWVLHSSFYFLLLSHCITVICFSVCLLSLLDCGFLRIWLCFSSLCNKCQEYLTCDRCWTNIYRTDQKS